jgi:hypothetical protein
VLPAVVAVDEFIVSLRKNDCASERVVRESANDASPDATLVRLLAITALLAEMFAYPVKPFTKLLVEVLVETDPEVITFEVVNAPIPEIPPI